MSRDDLSELATQAAVAAWRKGSIFNSMTPDADYTRPPHEVIMARLADAILDEVLPAIIGQIIPLLRTSGVKHPPFSDLDVGYDMGLDTVLDLLGWGQGDV